jgi:hypothetical protein
MQSSNSDLPRSVAPANEMTTMAQSVPTPFTRRSVVAGLAVAARRRQLYSRRRIRPTGSPRRLRPRKVCTSGWVASSLSQR